MARHEEITLSRDLGLFTITMIGVGGMIGAGIFVLTGIAAGVAGPALVLVFLLNGIVTSFTALSYAELGSAFPEAGGGYLWVKEGLGGANGYLSGWMSWFAHAAAGSLYGLGFGRFAAEIWVEYAHLPMFGLSIEQLTMAFMTMIIVLFTYINYRGASETGTVGNIVTMTKIVILGLFVLFGMISMFRSGVWVEKFTTDFMPNGWLGVFSAMGLTFIAFEGYEIIAQSGEEAIDPKRNVPRAIIYSIIIAVGIYLLVSITALGATTPPEGVPVWQYLGQQKEIAIVDVAQQTFPFGVGGIVLLLSGLVSTMSALNATTYSSSRVSFAMARDHNLPAALAVIDPKTHTPRWAVIISGTLILLMAWLLPIEDVAAAADIMFLVLFLQVNVTVMALRKKMPELDRGFKVPWMPVTPLIAIALNGLLATTLFHLSPIAWYFAIGWVVLGLLLYYGHFSRVEQLEKPKEILQEEVLVSKNYSVVVPVDTIERGHILGKISAVLARDHDGEVLALHVIQVPPQLTLGEGRTLLKEGRPYLEAVIEEAKQLDVPVHTVLRLGRKAAESIRKTVHENAADLLVIGWPGHTHSSGYKFGSVIDPLMENPPTDTLLVRYRPFRPLKTVLVPVGGGPNSRRAAQIAVSMARQEEGAQPKVILLFVTPQGSGERGEAHANKIMRDIVESLDYENLEQRIIQADNVAEAIVDQARGDENHPAADLVVIGATNEPIFRRLLVGNTIEKIVDNLDVTVIVVKRRSGRLQSFLRETVLVTND